MKKARNQTNENLEQRFDRIDKNIEDLAISVAKGFGQIDKRFEQVDKRFEQVDRRFEQVDRRFEQIETRLDNIEYQISNIKAEIEQIKKTLKQVIIRLDKVDKRTILDDEAIIDIVLRQQKKINILEKRIIRLEAKQSST